MRNLWAEIDEPFAIALAGYAVVAPDYRGLGIANITSPYSVLPAQANELYHAVAAAQSKRPSMLSQEFVVAGQSQDGDVAWAAAQRQHSRPVGGYMETMADSPFTDVLAGIQTDGGADRTGWPTQG